MFEVAEPTMPYFSFITRECIKPYTVGPIFHPEHTQFCRDTNGNVWVLVPKMACKSTNRRGIWLIDTFSVSYVIQIF